LPTAVSPDHSPLIYPWGGTLPTPGNTLTLRPGLHWLRMPLPFALNHINLWALDDVHEGQPGWTVVDAGVATETIRTLWQALWRGPLAGKPLSRMLVTHMHPDHVGNAQWLIHHFSGTQPAHLWMSATDYLAATLACQATTGYGPLVVSCGNQRRQSVVVVAPCGHVGKSQSGLSTCPCGLVVHELEAVS
jgi:glyoxylase-like metal-dependent hydrolase (beta-lactamase superfamily II)